MDPSSTSCTNTTSSSWTTDQKVIVLAHIRPKAEHYEKAKAAIVGILNCTHAEPGCEEFRLHESSIQEKEEEEEEEEKLGGNGILTLYEVWKDQTAFDDHHAAQYTKDVFEAYKEWLAEPPKLEFLKQVSAP